MSHRRTLVHVLAGSTIPIVAGVADADEGAQVVDAVGLGVAVGQPSGTLLNIIADCTVSCISHITGAGEGTNCVGAAGLGSAVMTRGTLVHILTDGAIANEPSKAGARK